MFHGRDYVAVVEIILYVPLAILAFINCFRHDFNRTSGWIYTIILCLVRIGGAICQFISHSNHSTGLIEAMIIFDSIGLSPLLLATLGLLHRYVDFIKGQSSSLLAQKYFRLLQVLITVGLILGIVGGTSGNVQPNGTVQVAETSKISIILSIVAYSGIVLVFLLSAPRMSAVPQKERRVPVAILLALPLILVRLVYGACLVFIHNKVFNIVNGNIAARVCMAVIEELIVVTLYVSLGFLLERDGLVVEHESLISQ